MIDAADASARIAGFCRALRFAGIPVTIGEEIDVSRALGLLRDPSRADFRVACRVALLKDPSKSTLFDDVFDRYWSLDPTNRDVLERELRGPRPGMTSAPGGTVAVVMEPVIDPSGVDAAETFRRVLYSRDAPARARLLRGVDREALVGMQRRARRLRRRVATLPGRRYAVAPRGEVDFRQAARRSLRYAGEWMDLPRRARRLARARLVVLWDVSGSMEDRHVEHLGLVYALQRAARDARVFAFGADLHEVTALLRSQPYRTAVARMSTVFRSWGGGTRIGACLARLNADQGPTLDRRTVLVILSDGWDLGDLEVLRKEMASLRRRCGLILWLNPQASDPGFRPEVAGLREALPYVDLLLSTGVLTDPAAFRRELGPSLGRLV